MRLRQPGPRQIDEAPRDRDTLDPGPPADGSRLADALAEFDLFAPELDGFDVARGADAKVDQAEDPAVELEDAGVHARDRGAPGWRGHRGTVTSV
ncbi:MAG TPA: hypothetical protein VF395_17190 [Polyangiaceae bacterium]